MIHLLALASVLLCVVSTTGQLREAWGQFLSGFPWDWFVTLTFREEIGSYRAHRLFESFIRALEKAAGIPLFWFRVDEIGGRTGRFHIHALIGNVAHLRRMTWVDWWDRVAGYARILPFEAKRGAAYYCAKYLTKQLGDWELSDNLRAFTENQPVLSLEGMSKPRAQQPEVPRVETTPEHRKSEPNSQLPLPAGYHDPIRTCDAVIGEVYRSEVTRGRGRYREFFPTKYGFKK